MVQPTRRLLVVVAVALLSLAASAKADDIVFSGDQASSSPDVAFAITSTSDTFVLTNAALDSLTINGASVGSFSGDLSITGVTGDDATDSSGDYLFNGGTLTITSGSTTPVTAQLLGSALVPETVDGVQVEAFLAVLDPNNTTFGGALASEGPLDEGLGETVQILVPAKITADEVVLGGYEVGAQAILVTPEPSTIALLAIGIGGLLIMSRRRFRLGGLASH